MCATVATAHDFAVGGICYKITSFSNKTVAVTYDNSLPEYYDIFKYAGNIVIPGSVTYDGDTYSVTSIDYYAFGRCTGLTSIAIPNSVTSIGHRAFEGCSGLTSIVIPNSVISIGESAFGDCSGLTSLVIPNCVTNIGQEAFDGCSGLTSIVVAEENPVYDSRNNCNAIIETATNTLISGCQNTVIPNSVTSIGYEAFIGCTGLTSVVIPNSVTSIGSSAFSNCSSLTSIEIPNSVTIIGEGAFSWCSALASVVVAEDNPVYDSRNNCNAIIETATNTLIAGCKNTTIPGSVTSIGGKAFVSCTGLTVIEIPNSVTSIGYEAFFGCTGLTSVVIPNSVTSIGDWAFFDCSRLTSIEIPNSVISIGFDAFSETVWYHNQPDGVVYAGKVLYKYKGAMPENTSMLVKEGIVSIGQCAFEGCSSLASVIIPGSVTSIGDYAFRYCSGLTSIVIPGSVTSIGNGTFRYCTGLTGIEIPNSVTSIGECAFERCTGLTSIAIPNSVTSIGRSAFASCSGLTSIVIPNSVTSIGDYAFSNCEGIKTVVNFSELTFTKGSSAYGHIAYYAAQVINASNGYVDAGFVFGSVDGANTLLRYVGEDTDLVLPADCKGESYEIGENAFSGCTGLSSIVIPGCVTAIGNSAFSGCRALASIEIPNSVTSVGDDAFLATAWFDNHSDGIVYAGRVLYKYKGTMPANASIVIAEGTVSILDYAFNECIGLTSIEIPASVTNIGDYAFFGCKDLISVAIPASVINIGDYVFYGCKNLTTVSILGNVTTIGNYAFYNCSGIASIEIPNSVTSIGEYAFFGCSLASVVIPGSVTSIGTYAFGNNKDLTEVTSLIPAEELFKIPDIISKTFQGIMNGIYKLYVPLGTKDTYAATSGWDQFSEVIEKELTAINEVSNEVKGQSGKVKTVYDLSGRAVKNPANGIYIIDGKKVLVK